jgi:hypothetical protein
LFHPVSESYHHNKAYHVLVVEGNIIISHDVADFEATAVHPSTLNVIVRLHVHAGLTNQFSCTPHLHG